MADWDQLREVGHRLSPPAYESLAATARSRRRRDGALLLLAALALVGGVGMTLRDVGDDPGPVQPVDRPTPSTSVRTLPENDHSESSVDLEAGRYRVPLGDGLAFEIDLPEHTTAHDDGLFLATEQFVVKTEVAGAEYGVPVDPCTDHRVVPVGPTVDDLVRALADLSPYQVTRPEPVELGGADGSYVEARIPRSYDASDCDSNAVQLPSNPATAVGGPAPYLGRWWVLDVDGRRVVVQQNCWGCSPHQFDRAPRTPQSIRFVEQPGS